MSIQDLSTLTDRNIEGWLNQHKNLYPDQQEKLLENDPGFKRLPPERQGELKESLHKFNSLTPEQRQRALNRMQWLSSQQPDTTAVAGYG